MKSVEERAFEYRFGDGTVASNYDRWPFYRDHFLKAFGSKETKAVDVVASDPDGTLWLIEAKDYRVHPRTKPSELAEEVALKVRDTLAGLFAAAKRDADHAHRGDARKHLGAKKLRVALHLEQPAQHSILFPRRYDEDTLQKRIKQLVKAIDPHPRVYSTGAGRLPLTWEIVPLKEAQKP